MVERMYQWGKAVNTASHFEIDDVIDPADSRRWITTMLAAAPASTENVARQEARRTSTPGEFTRWRCTDE